MSFKKFLYSILVLSLGLVLFTACSDDDDDDNGEEHHLEAVGVRVMLDGTVLAEADGTDVTGEIALTTTQVTGPFTVMFLDPDSGEWYDPEDRIEHDHEHEGEEEEHELVVESNDVSLLTVIGHDDNTALDHWKFQLTGLTAGQTSISVQIYHNDHPDYVSPDLNVVITD